MIQKIGISIFLTWSCVVTISRAIRLPNDFAEAHWLLDYRFGFVKRGLVGALFSLFTGLMQLLPTAQLIATVSGVVFVLYCLLLLAIGMRIIHRSDWSSPSILAVLVFFCSPFMVMSAHLFGYYDDIIIMLAVLSIWLLLKGKIWFAGFVQGISVLVHESSLLIGLPIFCFAWLLVNSQRVKSGARSLPLTPLLLPIGAFLVLALSQNLLVRQDFEQSLSRYFSGFAFIQRNRATLVPEWLTATFAEVYAAEHGQFIVRLSSLEMYGLVFPSMFAILGVVFQLNRIRLVSAESIVLLGVCLAPQLMHLVAWDTARIWTYSILVPFMALWVYAEVFPERADLSNVVGLFCLAALALNIINLTPLMDGESEHLNLKTRLLLYTPALGTVLAILLSKEPVSVMHGLAIRGCGISQLFLQRQSPKANFTPGHDADTQVPDH